MELKDLENIAIRCETEDEAKRCCELADKLGWTWFGGYSYVLTDNCWCHFKKDTCYNFVGGAYQCLSYYKSEGYTIKPASWFLDNFKIQDMETKENNGSIAEMYACANDELKKVLESKFTKEELGIKEELPNTWEEFCEQNKVTSKEAYIDLDSSIRNVGIGRRDSDDDRNFLPSEQSAEAHLALMQLEQLRDKYRQGWIPDCSDNTYKYEIISYNNGLVIQYGKYRASFLSFQTIELRDKFFNNFIELIKIAKDLI